MKPEIDEARLLVAISVLHAMLSRPSAPVGLLEPPMHELSKRAVAQADSIIAELERTEKQ